jgi:chemotaxis protein methyltransferase CheR/type IV pilus assembly protein PilK
MHTVREMTDEQFSQWTELLTARTGMVLTEERRSFLTTSIGLRMNEIGCETYDDYLARLLQGEDRMLEWSILVDRITIHETRFFRHPAAIDLVRQYVLERPLDPDGKPLSIQAWSVGCSTGEEAYSLAIAIDQSLRQREGDAYFGITATDISQPSLLHGRDGIYSLFRLGKDIDDQMLSDYFEIVDEQHLQVKESLRKRVCFARLNLQDISHSVMGKLDVIYCQNVLIYFDRDARQQLIDRLIQHLQPGGLLILGSGEIHNLESSQVEKVRSDNTLAYRRVGT